MSELLDCLSLRHIPEPLWIKFTSKHLCICVFIDKHSRCRLCTANSFAALRVFGFSGASVVKNLPANVGDKGSVPWSGSYPGVGNSNVLQYSCLEKCGQRILAGYSPWVTESWTHTHTHTHTHTQSLLSQMLFYRKVKVKSLSHVQLCHPVDCSLPAFSIHGIFQARVLGWVAISFSSRSFQPRDRTQVSCIVGRHFTIWATREILQNHVLKIYRQDSVLLQTCDFIMWFKEYWNFSP